MKNRVIYIVLMLCTSLFADNGFKLKDKKSVYLSQVTYTLNFETGVDSFSSVVRLKKDTQNIDLQLSQFDKNLTSQTISFEESGTWEVVVDGTPVEEIWVIPGWFSLLPPVLAILLALITRQVLVALFTGVFFGAVIIHGYNPFTGFFYSLSDFIAKAPVDSDRMAILIFSLTLGGMVGIISKSGGTQGIVDRLSRYASDSKRGQFVTWLMGIFIFFDDYANTLIVGNTMRPLTDKLKISREKLAYLVDSTAAPIATVALVSTWIGYQLSLIDGAFNNMGLDENSYFTFIKTIPFSFYPLFALLFGFYIAVTGRDFGDMFKAEKRAKDEGKLLRDGAVPLAEIGDEISAKKGAPLRWQNAFLPVFFVILSTLIGLWISGIIRTTTIPEDISWIHYISLVIGNADSFTVLIWSAFTGSLVAIILAMWQKILTLNESIDAWVNGVKAMLIAAFILILAWTIGDICKELQTAEFVIQTTTGLLSPHWIPAISFIIAGIIAFATGTSWATMAILTPIVIPLAYHLPQMDAAIDAANQSTILISSIAAILAGSTFGDHCSPISDTTIMSSMASGSDHVDHVRTQMPYALVVALVSIVFGFIPAGFGLSGWWDLTLGSLVLFLIVRFFGKKV